jgi:hypothetical protein
MTAEPLPVPLTRAAPGVQGTWEVELRAGCSPQNTVVDEVLPLIVRLEALGYIAATSPWPAAVTSGLHLPRRVRAAIRRIERVDESGAQIALVSRPAA